MGREDLIISLLMNRCCSFKINGAFVGDNELVLQNGHESQKCFSGKRNQTKPIKRKQTFLTEL